MPSISLKMRSPTHLKFASFNLKTLSAAVVSALIFSNAYAAGLGKLTVLSSLGQPLRAEIELTSVSKEEAGSLVPKLASPDAFAQANIDLNPALLSLRFAIEQRGSRSIIRVTSTQPMNEPFVDMLLELGGNSGRLVREYTFLLDPPDMRATQPAQVAQPIAMPTQPSVAQLPARQPDAAPQPARAERAPAQAAARSANRAPAGQAVSAPTDEYLVKKGDSLARISNQYRPSGVSLDQMLVALYRSNPDAFVGENMNRLRAGAILSVPDANTVRAVDGAEAKGIVIAQAADFNSYRNKLAAQVATASAKKSEEAGQSAAGKITAKVEEQRNAANESKDKLTLSKAGAIAGAGAAAVSNAGVSAEEIIAKDKAIAEANARVKELEKNVDDLQKLLEIKNQSLADQQQQANAAKDATQAAAPAVAAGPASDSFASVAPEADKKPGDPPSGASGQNTPAPAAASAAPAATAVLGPKPPAPVVPPVQEVSFIDDLLANPFVLPGAGILLAGLGVFGLYSTRRNKRTKSFEDSILTDSSLKANSLFGSTGGQSVDTNNSVFNSNFVPSASQLDTNEVDPVAEADVYIAYGRDAQAEEILKEALRSQPDRHAVRVKLLEIYANRKDLRSFEILASELYGLTKGEGPDWMQAASLGMTLDPNNPLYAAGKLPENVAARAAALTAPTQPLEDAGNMDASTSLDTSGDMTDTTDATGNLLNFDDGNPTPQEVDRQEPTLPSEKQDRQTDAEMSSSGLDFDLDGLDIETLDKKDAAPSPAQSEMPADLAAIDFDFLRPGPEMAGSGKLDASPLSDYDFSPADIGIASEKAAHGDAELAGTPNSLPEFDLSDIALELDPAPAPAAMNLDLGQGMPDGQDAAGDDVYSSSAEMATKLDLAIAYQEIGDKEGARELLDEVVKGGTGEQADKAKALLNKLS